MLSAKFSTVVLLAAITYYWFNSNVTYVTLQTKFGSINGVVSKSRTGREYHSFYGLPYALPPIGHRRFQSPVPFGPWGGVRDATKMGPLCPQYDLLWQKLDGQEDCLHLNVFTPKKSTSKELLPVIVFIHGGHFMFGASDIYGPQYFMDEDVVFVTLNYRIGALGFLNTGKEARGNMGLKDQALALKWLQEAVQDFGGNPNSVTIMGESAGGASVNYHMISPYSDGLFHRAISQSGTALCPWAFMTNTHEQGKQLARKVGCPIGTTESMMKCLKEIDVMKIIETQQEMKEVFHSRDATFVPSIDYTSDKNEDDEDVFLYDNPRDAYKDGQMVRVPWMLGVVPEEGCFRSSLIVTNQTLLKELDNNWNKVAPATFMYEKDDIVSSQIKNHYFGKAKNQFTDADYKQITNVYSDRYFFECTHTAATLHSEVAPTYLYDLTYKSGISVAQFRVAGVGRFPVILEILADYFKLKVFQFLGLDVPDYGVCHADDLQYMFHTISVWEISPSSPHYSFSRDLIKLWVSFAKTGSPGKFQNVVWDKVDSNAGLKYFELGSNPKTIPDPFEKGINFWKSLHV